MLTRDTEKEKKQILFYKNIDFSGIQIGSFQTNEAGEVRE